MTPPGTGRPRTVGFFSIFDYPPFVTDPYYSRTLMGIVYSMHRLNCNLVIRCEEGICEAGDPCVRPLDDPNLKGIIILSSNVDERKIGFLRDFRVPVVFIFARLEDPAFAFVDMDNRKGARLAVDHLVSLGHRRIAFIGGDIGHSTNARDRYDGYREGLREAGIREDPGWVRNKAFMTQYGYENMKSILETPGTKRPTAVFGATDLIAIGAMQAAKEAGLRVPEDLSVVGFDDIDAAGNADPPLTTFHQPFYEMGGKAVALLEALMEGRPVRDRRILLEPYLIQRSSTSAPAS
jgi:LacI family transcriptional regulator